MDTSPLLGLRLSTDSEKFDHNLFLRDNFNKIDAKFIETARMNGVSVEKHGAKGDGSDESVKIQAAVDELVALGGGRLVFPVGTFVFNNVTSPAGVFLSIEGQSDRKTILKPTTGQLFIIGGVTNTDSFRLVNLRIESTNDHDYDKPLIDLKFVRNIIISKITCSLSGTGTLFRFDTSYLISVRDCMLRTGRYSVGFDMTNITKPEEQQDTFKFDNVTIFGNLGVVVRRTGGNYHSIGFDGLKVLNLATDGDFGRYNESALTVQGTIGVSTLTVTSGLLFLVNDPIVIGYGEFVELNKITAINGNVLTIAKPLRFVQPINNRVITSGVAVSLSNPLNTTFERCHWEGMPVGIMIDSAKGLETISNYCGSGEFLRINGGLQDAKIGLTIMDDCGGRNIIVKVPTNNVEVISRLNLEGPFPIPSGSVALTPTEGLTANTAYTINTLNAGIYEKTINFPSGSSTRMNFKTMDNGNEKYSETYDGDMTWRGDTTLKYLSSKTVGMAPGSHFKVDGTWNGGRLKLGIWEVWIDASGNWRRKSSAPTSDTDGALM